MGESRVPTRTFISVGENLSVTQWYGAMTLEEMLDSQRRYMDCDNYRVGRPHLFDVSGVTLPVIDPVGMRRYIDLVRTQDFRKVPTRVSVFAPSDLLFALSRQFQTMSELNNSGVATVFRSERDALASVGKSDDCIDDLVFRYRDCRI